MAGTVQGTCCAFWKCSRNGSLAEAEALPMMDQLEKWIKVNPFTSADLQGFELPVQENRLSRELYKKHFS